ncbi:MAG: winged helix-turn-helix domain-containing protein [Vicinamibacterales bacterium]
MTYRFGPFEADRTTYRVTRDGEPVPLTPKLLDLLFHLVEHAGSLASKEELLESVWPGANVTDNALAQAVSELREALGDRPAAPTYIKTVARRGYRFVSPVEMRSPASPAGGSAAAGPDTPGVALDAGHGRQVGPATGSPDAAVGASGGTGAEGSDGGLAGTAGRTIAAPATGDPIAGTGRGQASASGVEPVPDPARTVVVLDFDNLTGDVDIAWLSAGIAETVTGDLAALGHFRVIDRWSVVQTSRRTGPSARAVGGALGARLAVTGGFQRRGAALRINARVADLVSGETLADAKVDGTLDDVFALQDAIVASLARALGVTTTGARRRAGRDTASLEAYRAYTEGWLKIESLDTDLVAASIRDFERAVAIDRDYALAHTGLANAAFVAYEMTRAWRRPDLGALAAGVDHARHAIELDADLAEAHATLSFLLVSRGEFTPAREAARRAVSLEPDSWRHQYRLGHASWGAERLRALDRATALYPRFPYAHFEAAMVHVARGDLTAAEAIARQGVADQDRQAGSGPRFPAIGFHWLLGALALHEGRHEEALAQFDRELEQVDPRRLYGAEYGALAHIARGQVELARHRTVAAVSAFRDARMHIPGHGRAHLGEAVGLTRLGESAAADAAWREVDAAAADFELTGRQHEAQYLRACAAAMRGDPDRAVAHLLPLVSASQRSFHGWTLPLEPFLRPLAADAGFQDVLARLERLAD